MAPESQRYARKHHRWVCELKKRRPVSVAARTVWALVAHQRECQKDYVSVRPY